MLRTRVATALFLLLIFLAALFWLPNAGWAVLAVLLAALAGWEWAALLGWRGSARLSYSAVAAGAAAAILAGDALAATWATLASFAVSAAFWCLAAPLWLVLKWRIASWAGALAGLVVVVPTVLALVMLRRISAEYVVAVVAIVAVADIAAYFVGRAFGRHKLAPNISPGKSWEGAAGAVPCVILYGIAVAQLSGHKLDATALLTLSLLLLVITVLSIVGDLFESLAKRQAGVKDSGSILPGHGGLLDRVDSLTATLPIIALVSVSPLLRARFGL